MEVRVVERGREMVVWVVVEGVVEDGKGVRQGGSGGA